MTGDAGATDPVCVKSPDHGRVIEMLAQDEDAPDLTYRVNA